MCGTSAQYLLNSKEIYLDNQPRYKTRHQSQRKPEDEPWREGNYGLSIRQPVQQNRSFIITISMSWTRTACAIGIIMAVEAVLLIHMDKKHVISMKPSINLKFSIPIYSTTDLWRQFWPAATKAILYPFLFRYVFTI